VIIKNARIGSWNRAGDEESAEEARDRMVSEVLDTAAHIEIPGTSAPTFIVSGADGRQAVRRLHAQTTAPVPGQKRYFELVCNEANNGNPEFVLFAVPYRTQIAQRLASLVVVPDGAMVAARRLLGNREYEWDGAAPNHWSVRRSELQELLELATGELGIEYHDGLRVKDLNGGVDAFADLGPASSSDPSVADR
jgi:hypothetical protein